MILTLLVDLVFGFIIQSLATKLITILLPRRLQLGNHIGRDLHSCHHLSDTIGYVTIMSSQIRLYTPTVPKKFGTILKQKTKLPYNIIP